MSRQWTVSEVARMAHVTVRTLHHYDHIGLLNPSERKPNGYRLYGHADLERLREILLLKELGFGLDAIRALLDAPVTDRAQALRAQREALRDRLRGLQAVARAVDRALEAMDKGEDMSADTMFDGFDQFDGGPYAVEAKERWGDTEAYRESMRRVRTYSKPDWERIKREGEEPVNALAALMAAGGSPTDAEAMDAAERARRHIDRWFYPCSHEFHVNLAAMYETDPRFGDYYEKRASGLRDFVVDAIRANAERA